MDVLKIISQAIDNVRQRGEPPKHPGCTCGECELFPHKVWEWLHNRNCWRYVRAWVTTGNLDKEAIDYIKERHTDFWRWHEEYDQ